MNELPLTEIERLLIAAEVAERIASHLIVPALVFALVAFALAQVLNRTR